MNEFKIVLDENFGTYVTIPEASRKIWLEVSDDLEISEFASNLPIVMKAKYMIYQKNQKFGFIKQKRKFSKSLAKESLQNYLEYIYCQKMMHPILFLGLCLVRLERESEHGIGLKMSLNTMDIIDYGDAEVAYF